MAQWDIQHVMLDLKQARQDWRKSQQRLREMGGRELPSKQQLKNILNQLCGILFPMRLGPADLRQETEDHYIAYSLDRVLSDLLQQVKLTLAYRQKYHQAIDTGTVSQSDWQNNLSRHAEDIVQDFANNLAKIRRLIDADVAAAYRGDPAAHSVDEVLLCYPGIFAMIYHRISHQLYPDVPLLSRVISELAHSATGIDIHPGAQIGQGCFIDHGTGVVIGETCIIGERVRIYQAVTLGAKRFELTEAGQLKKDYARHPIIENDVVIYAGATLLGRITIGEGSTIGGNVWLTHSVPANSSIMQSPTASQQKSKST
ncbi:serine acetyltransferase [Acinetobacter larvae]|uniref:serine O-acetyltransferase n=1 Tax=Acinetobacter larvae TaxID=1789224 RepID=A0A1B2LZH5_9GAMM|nr:serine O-acetyltransferase EpsC [Acinetobacter larvae]AOA58358.1 serine acetyltransferase [Acinetobacter larvae]